MPEIDGYIRNPQQAMIDAVSDPVFRNFVKDNDLTLITQDVGGGIQAQIQALSVEGAKRVIKRLIDKAREAGVDLREWICSEEFDLCGKINNTDVGNMMRQLDAFLKNKWNQATSATLGVFAAFSQLVAAVTLGKFLAILVVLGVTNNIFLELCGCSA